MGHTPFPDLADVRLYQEGDPFSVWERLRRDCPVRWNDHADGAGFWALTRHADVVRVYKDARTFTSEQGMQLDGTDEAVRAAAGRMLVVTDPPRHTALRSIINQAFTPRVVRRLRDNASRAADEIVSAALKAGECDLPEVLGQLPVGMVCDMLGVPASDWPEMRRLTRTAFEGVGENGPADLFQRSEAHAEIFTYYADLAARRRAEPQDDVVSALVHGVVDGRQLSTEEVLLNCHGVITGGNETTRHAATGGVLALIEHPDQLARLRARPSLLPGAVEEILRWTSPAMHVLRTANEDTEIGGKTIRQGDKVTLWIGSANRDDAAFDAASTFDIERTPNRHLAFGVGAHHCIGAALARLELNVLYERLLFQVGTVELSEPVEHVPSLLVWGIRRMPVRLSAS